ncbi:MAG: adenylyl-sulfate kinase, partial [Bacteroidales bacterium]
NTPLEVCEQRDVKGLYAKARAGVIKNFTGVDAPYEAPEHPDVEIKSDKMTVEQATEALLEKIVPKISLKPTK